MKYCHWGQTEFLLPHSCHQVPVNRLRGAVAGWEDFSEKASWLVILNKPDRGPASECCPTGARPALHRLLCYCRADAATAL